MLRPCLGVKTFVFGLPLSSAGLFLEPYLWTTLVFRRPPFGLTLSSVRLLSFLDVFGPPLLPPLRFWTSSGFRGVVFGPLLASTEVVQQWQDIYVHRRHLLV